MPLPNLVLVDEPDDRVTCEFSTTDPGLTEVLATLRDLPATSIARHECEAAMYSALSVRATNEADRLRGLQQSKPA
jgi:hypothetical protein